MSTDEYEGRRGDYDQRERDYEFERGERYRSTSIIRLFLLTNLLFWSILLVLHSSVNCAEIFSDFCLFMLMMLCMWSTRV